MTETAFADRLKELIGATPANQFARRVKVGESLLRKYLAGATPGIDKVAQISDETGANLEWLVTGKGTKFGQELPRAAGEIAISDQDLPGFTLVPRLDVRASAGVGLVPYSEETLDYLAFQEGWLRSKGVNPGAARVITATGDSMEETIRDGDVLLVDTSIDRVRDNAIYVVAYGDLLLVKRVHKRINGSMQLISDNARYPAEEISAGEVDLVNIAGRVMWFGRSI